MTKHNLLFRKPLQRVATLLAVSVAVSMAACGGSSTAAPSGVQNRAFISNTYSGDLQIVDTQNDTTELTAQTTNSAGQIVQGEPVSVSVATTVTFEVLSPNRADTLVYDPASASLYIIDNSSETSTGSLPLAFSAGMAVFSPDSSTVYVPEPNASVTGGPAGLVQQWNVSSATNTANLTVPAARYVAMSPNGTYLLVFAGNSDSLTVINVAASPITYTTIPGFARPINAFFSSDGNTAYVLNCGPECGSSNPASVAELNIPSATIQATVPVGGASVGLLNGSTLYVAGSPVPPGTTSTFDAVNTSNMTRITTTSVTISDGFHTTMALAQNNKLYIGASTCTNTTTGCLSVVNTSNYTADAPLPPRGAITGLLAIANRDVVYAVEGGYLVVYDTDTDAPMATQIPIFTGALYGIVQVDQ